jgi:L-fuconolactonase
VIDAHQHFWTTARDDYGWLTPDDEVLYRDFGPGDLSPLIEAARITHTVLVQAAPTVSETRHLLEIAERTAFVAGVVGWAPLDDPAVADELDALARHPALVGMRPMIQDLREDDWMLRGDVARGLDALAARDLAFDALVLPRHLGRLRTLCARHPTLRVVVDHAAKPEIRSGEFAAWAKEVSALADETGAHCKLSGLVTEASADWCVDDLRRYVDLLLERFGPERLLWGSDWPVVELAGGFERWREATHVLLADLDERRRAEILGQTAARFYRLDVHTPESGEPV